MDDDDFGIGHGTCEAESLQFFFQYLDLTAGVRYRVKESSNFLCLDWVRHRIRDDLVDGRPFPQDDVTMDSAEYTVESITTLLKSWGLTPCNDGDEDRVSS